VTIGTPAGTPSASSVGRALSIRPLLAMAHGTSACER
jgi:hypothetical protein